MARLRSSVARIAVADGHGAALAAGNVFTADDGFQDAEFMAPEDSVTRPDAAGVVGTTKLGFSDASARFTVWHTAETARRLHGRDGTRATVHVLLRGLGAGRPAAKFDATYAVAFSASRRGVTFRPGFLGRGPVDYTAQGPAAEDHLAEPADQGPAAEDHLAEPAEP